jgi:hypothetical protein
MRVHPGAALAREHRQPEKKVFWGGGTVNLATSSDNHVLRCRPPTNCRTVPLRSLDIISCGMASTSSTLCGTLPSRLLAITTGHVTKHYTGSPYARPTTSPDYAASLVLW